ncbi:MAG: hypothetical protein JKY28_04480 [Sulfurimonas sp.]|nr:hypothetical protein [Sulfurimonas sp.]
MGGFAGGDEGGYWDVDSISSMIDKQNKASKKTTEYDELYSNISFVACKCESFTIEGYDATRLKSSGIYKAYKALNDFVGEGDSDIVDFFSQHKVVITQGISLSCEVAVFMRLVQEACNLIISTDELVDIEATILKKEAK